jgi:hypothetical protein
MFSFRFLMIRYFQHSVQTQIDYSRICATYYTAAVTSGTADITSNHTLYSGGWRQRVFAKRRTYTELLWV